MSNTVRDEADRPVDGGVQFVRKTAAPPATGPANGRYTCRASGSHHVCSGGICAPPTIVPGLGVGAPQSVAQAAAVGDCAKQLTSLVAIASTDPSQSATIVELCAVTGCTP